MVFLHWVAVGPAAALAAYRLEATPRVRFSRVGSLVKKNDVIAGQAHSAIVFYLPFFPFGFFFLQSALTAGLVS